MEIKKLLVGLVVVSILALSSIGVVSADDDAGAIRVVDSN